MRMYGAISRSQLTAVFTDAQLTGKCVIRYCFPTGKDDTSDVFIRLILMRSRRWPVSSICGGDEIMKVSAATCNAPSIAS